MVTRLKGARDFGEVLVVSAGSLLRPTTRGLPILPNLFAKTFVGLAFDKRSYYDALMLEVRQAKRPILIPYALSGRA
ncbi:unnamed protein product [Prunus armeniaca]